MSKLSNFLVWTIASYDFTNIKIKSFECPKSIRNYEKKIMLGTSDAWLISCWFHGATEPAYYIVDCQILYRSWPRLITNNSVL